jgi:hypothetical protein
MGTAVTQGAATDAEAGAAWRIRRLAGAAHLATGFAITCALWVVFLHPNGVLKLYTPMYGFSLVAVLVAVLVAMSRVGEGWPFRGSRLPAPLRGVLGAALAVGLTILLVHGFFWGFLGRYGVTYFSPQAIVAAGGVGAEFFNARENSSTAIVYLATAFLWMALVLSLGFGAWPWRSADPGARGLARLSLATLLAVVAYAVLFHPHVTQLFVPAQTMAGAPPWWSDLAQTGSASFNLGWVLAAVAVLVAVEVLWGGWPWRIAGEDGPLRGLTAFLGSGAAGAVLFVVAERAMNLAWGEPFQGGQYTDAPYFRHLHVAELAGFFVLATFALDTSFGMPRTTRARATRTIVAVAAAAALRIFYYSDAGTRLLGKVPGVGQPEDSPLVWSLLFLAVVLVQRDLFERWPLGRAEARS